MLNLPLIFSMELHVSPWWIALDLGCVRYDSTIVIVRYYSVTASGRVGNGAIAPEARYCAILWRGEHRIERRHLTGTAWKRLDVEVASASSSVDPDSEVWRSLAPQDAGAEIIATSMVDITAAPLRVAAAIDAQLRDEQR
jgi:hypothetical protein